MTIDEWRAVNAPRAVATGTEEALVEALEADIKEASFKMASREARAEYLLGLVLFENYDPGRSHQRWRRDVAWDLVARIRKAEPQARMMLVARAGAVITGSFPSFLQQSRPADDDFLAQDLKRIHEACSECLPIWAGRGQHTQYDFGMAAQRRHPAMLGVLLAAVGPGVAQELCAGSVSGEGPMDVVPDDDDGTQAILASCGAEKHTEEDKAARRQEEMEERRSEGERKERERRLAGEAQDRKVARENAEARRQEAAERRQQDAADRQRVNEEAVHGTLYPVDPPPREAPTSKPVEPPPRKPPAPPVQPSCGRDIGLGECSKPQ